MMLFLWRQKNAFFRCELLSLSGISCGRRWLLDYQNVWKMRSQAGGLFLSKQQPNKPTCQQAHMSTFMNIYNFSFCRFLGKRLNLLYNNKNLKVNLILLNFVVFLSVKGQLNESHEQRDFFIIFKFFLLISHLCKFFKKFNRMKFCVSFVQKVSCIPVNLIYERMWKIT